MSWETGIALGSPKRTAEKAAGEILLDLVIGRLEGPGQT
jgi:hypothetical protein